MTSTTKLVSGDDDRDQGDDALHRDEVTGAEVLGELEPEALPLEGGLGEHRAAEQQRDLQADDRDDRDESRLVGVLAHQAVLADPARSRRVDVGHVERADHVRAHQTQEDSRRRRSEHDRGQHGVRAARLAHTAGLPEAIASIR